MATASQTSSSRLQLLQARFQQKQLQEKEQKLLQLYDQQQQRAHQVAQRGSAGSNGSNHSVGSGPNKVKQLFSDSQRRQQNGVKGIDKSYPLEPLKNNKKPSLIHKTINSKSTVTNNNNTNSNNNNNHNNMTNRKLNSTVTSTSTSTKRLIKSDMNSNESSNNSRSIQNFTASSRQQQQQQQQEKQENLSRESYGSTSNYSTTVATEANIESIRQVNGHGGGTKNGYHYEINIDEVIDNEALQRNRMLAKFQPGDIERRRRQLSAAAGADIDVDTEFPEDITQYDVSSRKSSLKNTKSSNPTITTTTTTTSKKTLSSTIPRQSTVMKTTQSASMKVCKPPQNHKRLVMRRKSSLVPRKPKKVVEKPIRKRIVEPLDERCCEISERCFPPPWNTLKSTSLICEIIKKHSKLQQMRNKSKMGRVKTIVTKIENQTIFTKPSSAIGTTATKFVPVAKSIEKRLLEMTRDIEPVASTSQEPLELLNANFVEALKAAESNEMVTKDIENEDQGDGLIPRNVNIENPSDSQEIIVANQTIESRDTLQICPARKLSAENVNRVRRESFEQKRMMFELLHRRQRVSRYNSVESVLRHFNSINEPKHDKKQSYHRSCRKDSTSSDSGGHRILKGFERSTSAWTIRTSKPAKYGRKKKNSKKILEARDSIELARVPVITNLPACKKKIMSQSKKTHENDDASPSSYTYQQLRGRSSSPEVSAKYDCYVTSTTKKETSSMKKADSITKVTGSSSLVVKNVSPYPSSKSPEHTEPRSRSVVKSTSLKLLNRFAGSNIDVTNSIPNESTDHPTIQRKSSVHLESSQHDEKLPTASRAPITPAPRTSPSSSSIGTTRSQGSRPTVTAAATKAKTPTPAIRTTAPASTNADDLLVTCKICSRRFQSERIVKHEQICAKTAQKKRKQFDAVGHRVRGTELESFVQKPNKKQNKAAAAAATVTSKAESQKSNWRRKHEDFINAIRSAKQMQAHLAAGGKLSDLPPPPPSDNSDYVQCPHCSRKFNQAAAERHIPKCENMQHNKPKPKPKH